MKKKTVLFGGSFNPPHQGHKAIIQRLASESDIERVLVCPAFVSPFKSRSMFVLSDLERLERLNDLINEIDDELLTTKDICVIQNEIRKQQPSFTIQTVHELRLKYHCISLAMGADSFLSLHLWKNVVNLFESIEVCYVLPRYDKNDVYNEELYRMIHQMKDKIKFLKMPLQPFSSKKIRALLQNDFSESL